MCSVISKPPRTKSASPGGFQLLVHRHCTRMSHWHVELNCKRLRHHPLPTGAPSPQTCVSVSGSTRAARRLCRLLVTQRASGGSAHKAPCPAGHLAAMAPFSSPRTAPVLHYVLREHGRLPALPLRHSQVLAVPRRLWIGSEMRHLRPHHRPNESEAAF